MRLTKLLAFLLFAILCASTPSLAATRYWVPGGSGVWRLNTNNWAATSGGASGASIPTNTDDVVFDANSGSANYTVDMNNALAHNLTIGAPSSGTVSCSGFSFGITGNLSIAASGVNMTGCTWMVDASSSNTITSNGNANGWGGFRLGDAGNQTGTWTLADDFKATDFRWISGNFSDGGFTFNAPMIVQTTGTATWTASANETWGTISGITTTGKTISQSAGTITFSNAWGGSNISAWTFLNLTSSTCPTAVGGVHVTGTFTIPNSCTLNVSGNGSDMLVNTLVGTSAVYNYTSCSTSCSFTGPAMPSKITANVGAGGTFNFGVDATLTGILEFGNGTVNFNGHNVSASAMTGLAGTSTLTWTGSEVLTLTGTGTVFTGNGTMTLNPASATIKVTDVSASSKTFSGGGKATYPTLWFNGCGTGAYIISGANTFTDIKMDSCGTNAQSLSLPASTTNTLGSSAVFAIGGQSGHVNTLISSSSGTKATLSKASGTIAETFLSIKDSNATGGATFNAFLTNGNVNNGNNSGWNFNPPPGKGLFHSFPP